jgi:hypothetical protein
MKWYDYAVCLILADIITVNILFWFVTDSLICKMILPLGVYGGWVLFVDYANLRAKLNTKD